MKQIITNFNDKTGDFEVTIPIPFTLKDGIEYAYMVVADIPKYEDIKDYNVFDLIRENQELKKQLHKSSLEIQHLIEQDREYSSNCSKLKELNKSLKASRRVSKHHLNRELDLENQQKEFIAWLEQNIENEEYCYLAQSPGERCRKDVFEEILSKYKEIIGDIYESNISS